MSFSKICREHLLNSRTKPDGVLQGDIIVLVLFLMKGMAIHKSD